MSKHPLSDLLSSVIGEDKLLVIHPYLLRRLGGDHLATLFFEQLMYWHERTTPRGSWVAKTDNDWYQELLLTKKQLIRIRKVLEDYKLIKTVLRRSAIYNGQPVLHYRIDMTVLNTLLSTSRSDQRELPESDQRELPEVSKGNIHITESTSENIAEELPIAKATEQATPAKVELPHIDYNALITAIEQKLGIKATAAKRYATMLMGTATSGEWKECAMPKDAPVTAEELTAFCAWWRKKNPNLHLPTSAMRLQSELLSYRDTINAPKRAKTPQDASNNIFGGVS